MSIVFACTAPHPPILLPSIGAQKDREKVKETIQALSHLGEKFKESNPDLLIISSPHPDWGFDVPMFFVAKEFQGKTKRFLTDEDSPSFHFEKGKSVYLSEIKDKNINVALIASGDTSHTLKEEGPYQYHIDGGKFDKELIKAIENKDISTILDLNSKYPHAGECGLRSFSFLLGILEVSEIDYKPEVLCYEGPFGVGYLTVDFKV